MINLLPPDQKRELRAALTNTLLIRYNILMGCALAFLGLAFGVAFFYLSATKSTAEQTIADNNAKVVEYAKVQSQANEFKQNLSTAKQILDKEVRYSKVALSIAALMPPGTVLSNLTLDSKTFGTATTLSAGAKTYNDALALKNSFEKSPMFKDVHFESISGGEGDRAYPLTVSLSVTLKQEAAQ